MICARDVPRTWWILLVDNHNSNKMNIETGREFPFPNSQDDGEGYPSPNGSSGGGFTGRRPYFGGGFTGGGHTGMLPRRRDSPDFHVGRVPFHYDTTANQEPPPKDVDPPHPRDCIEFLVTTAGAEFVYLDRNPMGDIRIFTGNDMGDLKQQKVVKTETEDGHEVLLTEKGQKFKFSYPRAWNGSTCLQLTKEMALPAELVINPPLCSVQGKHACERVYKKGFEGLICDVCQKSLRNATCYYHCDHNYDVCLKCAEEE